MRISFINAIVQSQPCQQWGLMAEATEKKLQRYLSMKTGLTI